MCLWFPSNILCHETVSLHLHSIVPFNDNIIIIIIPRNDRIKQMRDKTKQKFRMQFILWNEKKKVETNIIYFGRPTSRWLTKEENSKRYYHFIYEWILWYSNAITKSGKLNFNFFAACHFVLFSFFYLTKSNMEMVPHFNSITVFHLLNNCCI